MVLDFDLSDDEYTEKPKKVLNMRLNLTDSEIFGDSHLSLDNM